MPLKVGAATGQHGAQRRVFGALKHLTCLNRPSLQEGPTPRERPVPCSCSDDDTQASFLGDHKQPTQDVTPPLLPATRSNARVESRPNLARKCQNYSGRKAKYTFKKPWDVAHPYRPELGDHGLDQILRVLGPGIERQVEEGVVFHSVTRE